MTDIITLDTISLPGDLEWTDEFTWVPTAQTVEIAFSGALIIEESAQLAGRPITLQGDFAWIQRSVIADLWALASTPLAAPLVLTLADERVLNVRFRFADGAPIEARPVRQLAPAIDTDVYTLTLRLMQV